jgi:transcriptional regulator with XRE-family HTH domain
MGTATTAGLIGEVRAEMARQKVTVTKVARATDISRASFSRKLNGSAEFTIRELTRAADFLGLPLSELASRAERNAA